MASAHGAGRPGRTLAARQSQDLKASRSSAASMPSATIEAPTCTASVTNVAAVRAPRPQRVEPGAHRRVGQDVGVLR